ncbi:mitochondrial intermembrane space import and assembly protein 40 homolog [Amborella trichopoda]|uniref:Mitochondrial intermembrane space import and assembly protein 40 homolog n=1 Tax=Amborella trichopoda TaxID=13333 RepID=W1PRA3_AMBTC|nr:mitochondrial intermembrane space import and assembly protein 40 homolog [Amborella trichopoda]ERN10226.1 hypothetical protein AMTR_s00171p00053250 [Amborella trichopoda]|eukprot:XP_011625031.1 mitochondrial intermembrane space import and assembly protein 40 homolog [Amborella trichopoda]
MGQVQSDISSEEDRLNQTKNVQTQENQPSSMEALIAEATAFGDDENESLEVRAQKALDCPCIADLRSGPCGLQFTYAFLCFMKSTAEEKGSNCVHPFIALQNCISLNPDAFSKYDLESDVEEEKDDDKQEYKIKAPLHTKPPKAPKPSL